MSDPKVSIILTVFNRRQFIEQALSSALAQSYRDFEIIVSDDGNNPEIAEICKRAGHDGRLRYRSNPRPLGVALNIRGALAEARGPFIALLNDDDVWEVDFLKKLVPPLQEFEEVALAFCDHFMMDNEGRIDKAATDANTKRYSRDRIPTGLVRNAGELVLLNNAVPLAMGSVFRKEAFDSSRLVEECAGLYDRWMSANLAATGRPFYYVNERLSRYRVHGGSETARRAPDKSDCKLFFWSTILKEGRFPALQGYLRRAVADSWFRLGKDKLYFRNRRAAFGSFRRAFRTRPNLKYLIAMAMLGLPSAVLRRWGWAGEAPSQIARAET